MYNAGLLFLLTYLYAVEPTENVMSQFSSLPLKDERTIAAAFSGVHVASKVLFVHDYPKRLLR